MSVQMTDSRSKGRAPGASTQEILHRDGRPIPSVYETTAPVDFGNDDIPFWRYTNQEFFDLEMEKMWKRTWQWACREEHIAEPGDWITYEIGDHSVLIVRNEVRQVNAFTNSCMHRGTKLRKTGTEGHSTELRCPFHGWTWTMDGELKRVPSQWDAPHVCAATHGLSKVRVGLWGGFVFINLDENAPPLEDYLQPLQEHMAAYKLETRFIETHIQKELFCNWKAAIEAFVENYHIEATHPEMVPTYDHEAAQYDVFSPNVSRFLAAVGVSNSCLERPLTEQELVNTTIVGARNVLDPDVLEVGEGETARMVVARALRQILGQKYRVDLSGYTDTETIDGMQYGIFPNMILFPGLSLPAVYRFRPIGNDPDRTLFELLMLRVAPDQGDPPPPPEPIRLREDQSFAEAGFEPFLSLVFDQDTDNLRSQQEGFKAARKKGETLLTYQEVRIRHLHNTLDSYLNA